MAAERKLVERVPSQVKFFSLLILALVVCFVAAYFFGVRGTGGPIDVNATIREGERIDPTREKINTDTRAKIPNGGLVPTGAPSKVQAPPPAAAADDSAITTEEAASTTDAEASGDDEAVAEDDTTLEDLSTSLAGDEAEVEPTDEAAE